MLTGTSGTPILFELQSPAWIIIQKQRQKQTDWGAQSGLSHCNISNWKMWSEGPGLVPVYIGSYGELCYLLVGL